jgi:DegV family protein with EDD domain
MTKKHKIALITDSTCDVPPSLIEEYGIYVVPLYVLWGNEQFKDRVDIQPDELYARLAKDPVHPSTSQPTPKDFADIYKKVKEDGAEEAVVVCISDGLSGTVDSAQQAREMCDLPVHIVDSKSVSMGLGWQVLAAARIRGAGGDAAEMVAATAKVRETLSVVFTVDTLEYLHKGGRIGAAAKLLGTALQLKPSLLIDPKVGIVEPGAKVRTRKKALETVYQTFFEKYAGKKGLRIAILTINCPEESNQWFERIQEEHCPVEMYITPTSPVVGIHGGPGTMGLVGYIEG